MEDKFNENDIRPRNYEAGLKLEIEKDVKFLVSHKQEFVQTDCPACNSPKKRPCFQKYSFDFVACEECETVYMNPRATVAILSEFYAHSNVYDYWNKFIFPVSDIARREKIVKPRVSRVIEIAKKYNVNPNCLVEVGSGFGTFAEEAMVTGFFKKVIAIEPVASLAETCRQKGVEVIESAVEKIKEIQPEPSIIVSFEVIEHLFSPYDFLKSCSLLMPFNSIIAVTCPNFKGFDISTLGLASDSLDAEHINLFNTSSIKTLFERAGFEILQCFTPGEIDVDIVRNKVLENEFDISGQSFLNTILFERWEELGSKFQNFLKVNNLSSHMWVVARKI